MPSFSVLNQRILSVTVEYDDGKRNERVRRTFSCPFAARRFYVAKSKAGRNPRVVTAVR